VGLSHGESDRLVETRLVHAHGIAALVTLLVSATFGIIVALNRPERSATSPNSAEDACATRTQERGLVGNASSFLYRVPI
jgi:hypothetical protein